MKRFIVSVVVPVYNTELYLRETIESIIDQTLGFEDNIELILVNNKTEDNSEKICLEYASRYTENIKYIKVAENHGPCSARNAGQKIATGKYINFLDSDDKWERTAFVKAINYFEKNYETIDILSCRIKRFDAISDYDFFDYRFDNGTRIVDIENEPKCLLFTIGASFIKTEVAKQYVHDERIRHSEDMKYLTEILFNKKRYGLLKEAVFLYRSRFSGDSTVDRVTHSSNWYMETSRYSYLELIKESKEKTGKVLKYLQNILFSEIDGRLRKGIPEEFDEGFAREYRSLIAEILKNIEDIVIIEWQDLSIEYKLFALKLKYGEAIGDKLTVSDNKVYFKNILAIQLNQLVYLRTLTAIGDYIVMTGIVRKASESGTFKLIIEDFDGKVDVKNNNDTMVCLGRKIITGESFSVLVPLKKGNVFSLYIFHEGKKYPVDIQEFKNSAINTMLFKIERNQIHCMEKNKNSIPSYYLFPFEHIDKGEKVFIYGAGYIGRQYAEQLRISNYCKMQGVIDNNYQSIGDISGYKVYSPQKLLEDVESKIIIALGNKQVIYEVINNLVEMGVSRERFQYSFDRIIPWT